MPTIVKNVDDFLADKMKVVTADEESHNARVSILKDNFKAIELNKFKLDNISSYKIITEVMDRHTRQKLTRNRIITYR